MDFHEIIITVPAQQVDTAGDIANMCVPYGIYIEDYQTLEQDVHDIAHIDLIDEELLAKDRTQSRIHIYLDPGDNPAETIQFLNERYQAAGIHAQIDTTLCLEQDWANNWKKYFHPTPVGNKILIQPVWEEPVDANGRTILRLEPGLAFGTGTHETTRLCLEMAETYLPPNARVLDVGCGSGILSAAALLLGAQSAVGVDIDAAAVRTAQENCLFNGVGHQFTGICGSLIEQVTGQFDLIFANIVADVILTLNQQILPYCTPHTIYLISGIIDQREKEILDDLKDQFEVLEIRRDRGWSAIAARPRTAQ